MKSEKAINISGHEVVLKRRIAKDVNDLAELVKTTNDNSSLFGLFVSASVVAASLKRTYNDLKWHQFKLRRLYKKLINPRYLIKMLSEAEIYFYQVIVLALEGQLQIDVEKLSLSDFTDESFKNKTPKKKEAENLSEDLGPKP